MSYPFSPAVLPLKWIPSNLAVSAKQIFDWLNQPTFRQELENRKNEAVNQAVDRLKLTASKACDTLIGLFDNTQSDSIKHGGCGHL
jgi:hypothetical protein